MRRQSNNTNHQVQDLPREQVLESTPKTWKKKMSLGSQRNKGGDRNRGAKEKMDKGIRSYHTPFSGENQYADARRKPVGGVVGRRGFRGAPTYQPLLIARITTGNNAFGGCEKSSRREARKGRSP